jgi:hypothetical protein
MTNGAESFLVTPDASTSDEICCSNERELVAKSTPLGTDKDTTSLCACCWHQRLWRAAAQTHRWAQLRATWLPPDGTPLMHTCREELLIRLPRVCRTSSTANQMTLRILTTKNSIDLAASSRCSCPVSHKPRHHCGPTSEAVCLVLTLPVRSQTKIERTKVISSKRTTHGRRRADN